MVTGGTAGGTLVRRLVISAIMAVSVMGSGRAMAAAAPCPDLMPPDIAARSSSRTVTPEDLVGIRDIGMPGDYLADRSPVSVSPDGRRIAFILRRAEPATNSFCQGLVVMDMRSGSPPRLVDRGGDLITYVIGDLRGAVTPTGTPDVIRPVWSPDGQWIAYRRREKGHTQAWLVRADGSQSHAATDGPDDVEAVAWSGDASLIIGVRPALREEQEAIDDQARSEGYLFGTGSVPDAGVRPFPAGPVAMQAFVVGLVPGPARAATAAEQAQLDPPRPEGVPMVALLSAGSTQGAQAWTQDAIPGFFRSPSELWMRSGNGQPVRCPDANCRGNIVGIWLSKDGAEVRYLRREGWGESFYAIYRWRPGRPARRVLLTSDPLTNCQSAGEALLCDRDGSTTPRRIVLIDPRSGRQQIVFNPNPDFERLRLGKVQRLHWTNERGIQAYGDLVLPPDHQDGQKHPLIIVQYRTKGFLRGGTGDEYPIQAFAARGYAVLSFERPPFPSETDAKPGDKRTALERARDDNKDWVDRRNILSLLQRGIDLVVGLGVVDRDRIGLTGMSDGAETAWFALNAGLPVKAAVLSSCCMDPRTMTIIGGEAWAKHMQAEGFPGLNQAAPEFWKPISLALNADHLRVPILMQLSDDEASLALESYESLREAHDPVELRTFPGEHHVKWQPAHRLAIYRRNLDWFDFWLRGVEDSDPAKRAEYARWRTMRYDADCFHHVAASASCKPVAATDH